MKHLITAFLILLLGLPALAQLHDATISKITEKPEAKGFASPMSIQFMAGSQGIGADLKYGFLPKLSARLGFSIIPVDVSKGFSFFSFPVEGQFTTRFSNVHLMADYSLFKTENIRLVGGASYLTQGNARAIISPTSSYTVGNRTVSKEQIGVLYADVTWKGVVPYLGVSLFKSFPKRLLNINLDLGTYYLSSPGTSFTGTHLLADNEANDKQFSDNMKSYRWMPVVQLNFNLRIKTHK